MSPEQAALSGVDADTRCDVYSLGVLLYELLTGTTPIGREIAHKSSHDEVRRMVRELDPPRPSARIRANTEMADVIAADRGTIRRSLRRLVAGELDWITMKALEKDRSRRYQTVGSLAADVMRYLEGLPVEAGPPSTVYRFKKFARRNRTLLTTAGLVAFALVAGTTVSTWQAIRATHAERRMAAALEESDRNRLLAERHLKLALLRQAREAMATGEIERAQEILDDPQIKPSSCDFAWGYLRRQARREIRVLVGLESASGDFAVSPAGGCLAYLDLSGDVALWGTVEDRLLTRLESHTLPVWSFNFSNDGERLVTIASDHDRAVAEIRVWDTRSARMIAETVTSEPQIVHGARLIAGNRFLLVDALTGDSQRLRRSYYLDLSVPSAERIPKYLTPDQWLVSTTDGQVLGGFTPGRLTKRDLLTGKDTWSIPLPVAQEWNLGLSPEGSRAVILVGTQAVILEMASGREVRRVRLPKLVEPLKSVLVGPRAERFVVVDAEGVLLWPGSKSKIQRISLTKPGRTDERFKVALSADGLRLATGSWGRPGGQTPIRIHDTADGKVIASYPGRDDRQLSIAFDADGRSLFLAGDGSITRWLLSSPWSEATVLDHTNEAWALAFSPDGRTLASGSDNSKPGDTIKLWDAATGKLRRGWRVPQGMITSLAFSPQGRTLASACFHLSDNLHLWDPTDGRLVAELRGHTERVRVVTYSPDGRILASGGTDRTIRLWDGQNGQPQAVLTGHNDAVRDIAFSPDGLTLASASNDGTVRLWDVPEASTRQIFRGPRKYIAIAFAPDGSSVAAADQGGTVTVWDSETGDRKTAIHGQDDELLDMAFGPDGATLATAGIHRTIHLWDALTGQELLELKGHEAQVDALAFSPNGTVLASCDLRGSVRLWRSEDSATSP
jgi:WD40 repeat protein